MKIDGISAIAVILIASFAIDRIVAGVLFLLSFVKGWRRIFPDPALLEDAVARARAEKKRKLVYSGLAGVLALLVVAWYGQVRILKATGFATAPVLDTLLTGLILMAGADRMTGLLKTLGTPAIEKPEPAARPIEITGKLILEEPAARKGAAAAGA